MRKKGLLKKALAGAAVAAAAFTLIAPAANASGITVYQDGEKYVKMGGRIQLQYHGTDTDGGATSDSLAFRRLRTYIEGTVHGDWMGKFQVDFGEASGDNEVAIKDAYMEYKGIKDLDIKVGNANFPFSRELLTSSKYQQLTERTFVGDHNYGTPDRQLGVHITGTAADSKLAWAASVVSADIDPSAAKLDFDTPINKAADFNEGWMAGARVEFHPFGVVKFSQGDFDRSELKASVGAAAFVWNNDGDNNGHAQSVEQVTGYEVSGALRYRGVSVDAEYNLFNADAVDTTLTSGIFRNGTTDLKNYSIEGGYMVLPAKLEVVAGYSAQDADNYAETWTRTELGANWFFARHDIKVQASYRMNKDEDGTRDNDVDEYFVQAQYVF